MDTRQAREYNHDLSKAYTYSKFASVNEVSLAWWEATPALVAETLESYHKGTLPAVEAASLLRCLRDAALEPGLESNASNEARRAAEEYTRIFTEQAESVLYELTCYPEALRGDFDTLHLVEAGALKGNPWPVAHLVLDGTHSQLGWLEDYDLGGHHADSGLPSNYALRAYTWLLEQMPAQTLTEVGQFARQSGLRGDLLLQTAGETLNLDLGHTAGAVGAWKNQPGRKSLDLLACWNEHVTGMLMLSDPDTGPSMDAMWDVLGDLGMMIPTVDEFLLGEVTGWPEKEPYPDFSTWNAMVSNWCHQLLNQLDRYPKEERNRTWDAVNNLGFCATTHTPMEDYEPSEDRAELIAERARMLIVPAGEDTAMRSLTSGASRAVAHTAYDEKPDRWVAACLLAGASGGAPETWLETLEELSDQAVTEFYENTWNSQGRLDKGIQRAAKASGIPLKRGVLRKATGRKRGW